MRRPYSQRARQLVLAPMLGLLLAGTVLGCAPLVDERVRRINEINADGVELFAKKDYRAALDSFDYVLTLNPNDAGLLYNIGQCYDRLGERAKAEQYYVSCLQHAPDHGDARLALVSLQYSTGRQAEAKQAIADWLTKSPKNADAYVLDGWRLRQEKALPQAQGRLQQALTLEPHNRRALCELGILYEQMGMPERAYVLYERVLAREPNQADVAERLSQLKAKNVQRPLPD